MLDCSFSKLTNGKKVKSDDTCGILNGHEGKRDELQYIVHSTYFIGHTIPELDGRVLRLLEFKSVVKRTVPI